MMLDMATNLSVHVRANPDSKDITVNNLLVVMLIVDSYMYMCVLVQFIAITHVAFLSYPLTTDVLTYKYLNGSKFKKIEIR